MLPFNLYDHFFSADYGFYSHSQLFSSVVGSYSHRYCYFSFPFQQVQHVWAVSQIPLLHHHFA
jgi:hypothetical protein